MYTHTHPSVLTHFHPPSLCVFLFSLSLARSLELQYLISLLLLCSLSLSLSLFLSLGHCSLSQSLRVFGYNRSFTRPCTIGRKWQAKANQCDKTNNKDMALVAVPPLSSIDECETIGTLKLAQLQTAAALNSQRDVDKWWC